MLPLKLHISSVTVWWENLAGEFDSSTIHPTSKYLPSLYHNIQLSHFLTNHVKIKINFLQLEVSPKVSHHTLKDKTLNSLFACSSHKALARMSHKRMEPLLLLYTNSLQLIGWNSAAVITSVSSSILAGLMSTMSGE